MNDSVNTSTQEQQPEEGAFLQNLIHSTNGASMEAMVHWETSYRGKDYFLSKNLVNFALVMEVDGQRGFVVHLDPLLGMHDSAIGMDGDRNFIDLFMGVMVQALRELVKANETNHPETFGTPAFVVVQAKSEQLDALSGIQDNVDLAEFNHFSVYAESSDLMLHEHIRALLLRKNEAEQEGRSIPIVHFWFNDKGGIVRFHPDGTWSFSRDGQDAIKSTDMEASTMEVALNSFAPTSKTIGEKIERKSPFQQLLDSLDHLPAPTFPGMQMPMMTPGMGDPYFNDPNQWPHSNFSHAGGVGGGHTQPIHAASYMQARQYLRNRGGHMVAGPQLTTGAPHVFERLKKLYDPQTGNWDPHQVYPLKLVGHGSHSTVPQMDDKWFKNWFAGAVRTDSRNGPNDPLYKKGLDVYLHLGQEPAAIDQLNHIGEAIVSLRGLLFQERQHDQMTNIRLLVGINSRHLPTQDFKDWLMTRTQSEFTAARVSNYASVNFIRIDEEKDLG